jgi:hypothetical protein
LDTLLFTFLDPRGFIVQIHTGFSALQVPEQKGMYVHRPVKNKSFTNADLPTEPVAKVKPLFPDPRLNLQAVARKKRPAQD